MAIGRLPDLKTLNLYQNEFNGTFPKEIGNLSNLEVLNMAYNVKLIPAPMPPEFGRLTKLKFLWMKQTNLIGEIPENISGLSSLEHLDLARNNLVGAIPNTLFLLKNLSFVYLFNNRLSGELPSLVEASNLIKLDFSMNNLTGSIPEAFGKFKNLTLLNLFSNRLTGDIPQSLGLLPLIGFRVFNNKLTGTLPSEFGLHSKLEAFEVSENQLSGPLPEHLCDGDALQGLIAFSNNLTGELPEWVGNCRTLRTVQVHENNLSGEVPSGLWTSVNLSSLMLSDNSFSGELPDKLGWNLSRLEIGNNKFSGQISVGVASWNLVVFEASNNRLLGKIPVELTSLPRLTSLLLDGNQLSGEIPSEIISWESLTTLDLSRNELSGQIPAVIGSLPDLLYLDLSQNRLSGEIPPQIGHLRLTALNLSSNQLSGKIPDQFNNLAYENSFFNNSNLCADTPILNLPSCYRKLHVSNKLSNIYVAMIIVLALIVFLVTVSLAFYKFRGYQKKKRRRDLATWKLTSFQRLGFREVKILSNLTENNLIGSGGSGKVYRIATDRPGEFVAVKRIWKNNILDHKLEKEFLAEVQILGTIRHSNIVKLLCCFSSETSKLLVYEYKENHSLDGWLHGRKRKLSTGMKPAHHHMVLDWPRRLRIATGAAQGLCYMHHDCSPPVLHRDVKSSNILLDSELKASIADFGLAMMLAKHGEPLTMSAVAGSFGYIAPGKSILLILNTSKIVLFLTYAKHKKLLVGNLDI